MEAGLLKPVARKKYIRNYAVRSNPVETIIREGYDAAGNVIRKSEIPILVNSQKTDEFFSIKDGAFEMKGKLPTQYLRGDGVRVIDHTNFKNLETEQVAVNLKSLGNLARSYLNNAVKYFQKIK
jgi:hypothetical protein